MMSNVSFHAKIVLGFLGLLAISIGTLTWFATTSYEDHLRRTSLSHLEEIADGRLERFRIVTGALEGELRLARGYRNIQQNLPALIDHADSRGDPRYLQARSMLDQQLGAYRQVPGYVDLLLADRQGRIVYVLDVERDGPLLGQELPGAFLESSPSAVQVGPAFRDERIEDGRFVLLAAGPATDLAGQWIGTIVFVVDVATLLRPVWSAEGLGPTARVVVGHRERDGAHGGGRRTSDDANPQSELPVVKDDQELQSMMNAASPN